MSRVDEYRAALRSMSKAAWETYLLENSGLPGPRGNIELGLAVAEEASPRALRRWSRLDDEYLAVCGTIGLGRLLAEGDRVAEAALHKAASDDRWRVREAVAMALQRVGDSDRSRLLSIAKDWAGDASLLVRRAAAAGICEPRLLDTSALRRGAFVVLDRITRDIAQTPKPERRLAPFQALRKALGYCWSVAVAASPEEGFERFERWIGTSDPDLRWILKENLKKNRMRNADPVRSSELADRMGV